MNRAFRKRPPFPFTNRARPDDLPCAPCITQRGTHPTYFAELRTFPGPHAIGVTGDNSFETLYGREWAVLFCDDDTFHTLQWTGADDEPPAGIESRGWNVIPDPLLTLPPLTAGVERSITAAFDQNARLIVAYEKAGVIDVTRWDPLVGEYRQNVSFAGRDPQLLIDAALADPRAYPNESDDNWSAREAFNAGVPVLFEWLPDNSWRETAIPVSDVLLFYLSTDRERVMARVQREIYGIPRLIHDFGEPVTLDHAVALAGRYQLLVSDAAGSRLPEALISDPYLGDFIINPRPADRLTPSVTAGEGEHAQRGIAHPHTHNLNLAPLPGVSTLAARIRESDQTEAPLIVTITPGASSARSNTLTRAETEAVAMTATPGTSTNRFTTLPHAGNDERISVTFAPGTSTSRAA